MKIKQSIILGFVAVLITMLVSNFARDIRERHETERFENILIPVVATAVEGTEDPKPSLSLVTVTDKSIALVLNWKQTAASTIKNDLRERVIAAVRGELAAADPKSWGRYISVSFTDEVVTQGK